MLDHLRNSPGCHLDDLNVLVLDEVDRLLELGFKEGVRRIGSRSHRNTMLREE